MPASNGTPSSASRAWTKAAVSASCFDSSGWACRWRRHWVSVSARSWSIVILPPGTGFAGQNRRPSGGRVHLVDPLVTLRPFGVQWDVDLIARSVAFLHGQCRAELTGEAADELDAEPVARPALALSAPRRNTDPVVLDHQVRGVRVGHEMHRDAAATPTGEGIFDCVTDRLGDDQRKRHRLVARHLELRRVHGERDAVALALAHRLE